MLNNIVNNQERNMGSKILFKLVFINIVTGWAFTFFAVYVDHIPFENVYGYYLLHILLLLIVEY